MILEKIKLENFRQFHGSNELTFSTQKRKNITVIHAENGFGKTALLNALLWGFYGHEGLTEKFEQPHNIIHEGIAHSKKRDRRDLEARVTILFRHGDEKYTLSRSLSLAQQHDDPKKTDLRLEVQRDGQAIDIDKPQWILEQLMPSAISPYLFFDGEGIEHLAMEKNSGQIRTAIYQMLGLGLIEAAIADLGHVNVRGRLMRELKENTDESTVKLIEREQKLLELVDGIRKRKGACGENQSALTKEIEGINKKLEANREARALQLQRSRLDEEEKALTSKLRELTGRLSSLIAEDGYTLFAEKLVQHGREITQRLRQERRMPAKVLNVFIDELLSVGECVCGCVLSLGSPERQKVEALRTIAGDQHFNNAVSALDHALGLIDGVTHRVRTNLKDAINERDIYKRRLRKIEEEQQEIHEKLGGKDDEEIADLEKERERKLLDQRELTLEEGRLQKDLSDRETELAAVHREIESSKQVASIAAKAQRRLKAVDDSIALLEKIREHEMRDLRKVLNDEIDAHFQNIIDRAYWAELSEDFVLRLKKRVGIGDTGEVIDVAKSTGQGQVTSLVFIASLVALARRRSEIPTILKDVEGGEYPMVMDSPFGQLGDEFRAGVAKWIPTLAPQVIIFVSSSQYKGKVEEMLNEGGKVGQRYILAYYGPSKRTEAASSITLGGKRFTQYFKSDVECTEIKDIEL
jgi:DNA sulfur modification protein DndD